jgi:uncharacterized membrane protein
MATPDERRLDAMSEAIAGIRRAQTDLNQRLLRIEAALGLSESLQAAEPPAPVQSPPPPLPSLIAAPPATREAPAPLETSIGLTLISRAGALTLVLGIGFFFKWAADNQWIGPAGRVILGVLAGCAALAAAEVFLRRGQRIFSQALAGVGIAILYLAFYASYGFYNLLAQSLAFALMAGVTALAGVLASRQKALPLAVMGLIGGLITPLLLSSGEDRPWFLFSYVLVLDVGALALVRRERWRALEISSFAGTVILFGLWLNGTPEHRLVTTFFGLLYYAFFALTAMQPIVLIAHALVAVLIAFVWRRDAGVYFPLALPVAFAGLAISDRRRRPAALSVSFASFWAVSAAWATASWNPPPVALFLGLTCGFVLFAGWVAWRTAVRREIAGLEELSVIALNGGAYFGCCYYVLDDRYHAWMGLFALALAGVHAAMGALLHKWDTRDDRESSAALLSLGVALCFLTLAVPIQLTAYRITMAWALEAAALTWIGVRMGRRAPVIGALVVFALVVVRLIVIDAWIYSSLDMTLLNARFLTFAVSAASLFAAAWWLKPRIEALACHVAGQAVLLWALTQETLEWAGRNAAPADRLSVETFSVSVLYAIYAVLWIGMGVATRTAVNRITGLLLIGFVVLKLYLFDVWQLGRLYRISAFVALGVLLLATSFLYSHFRALIESWWKDEEAHP